jgi:hypothetical protein
MLILIHALILVFIAASGPTPTEAISRSYTVLNLRTIQSEAMSRCETVLNTRTPSNEALSRSGTILNSRAANASEVISRAVSVCDVGDLNLNGQLDYGDIELFVAALLNIDANQNQTWAADMNCDFVTDALDIQEFVNSLIR